MHSVAYGSPSNPSRFSSPQEQTGSVSSLLVGRAPRASQYSAGFQMAVLGNLRRELARPHDDEPRAAADHRLPHVGAIRQHRGGEIGRFPEARNRSPFARQDRITAASTYLR